MQYADLHGLVAGSSSARQYFLSLPVALQMQLHEHNACIHSADQLHRQADLIEKYNRAAAISDSLNGLLKRR